MDIYSLRKSRNPRVGRMQELRKKETSKLRESSVMASGLLTQIQAARSDTERNTRAMLKAVALSQQPGAIAYNQRPIDPLMCTNFNNAISSMNRTTTELGNLRSEVSRLESEERASWSEIPPIHSFNQWFSAYGQPKRTMSRDEKYLSYVARSRRKVKGAESRDGTVQFPTLGSSAAFMRKGILI